MTSIKIEGLREINNVLAQLPKSLGKAALTRFGKKRLEPMRAAAAAKAPNDTGELADEMIVSTKAGGPSERRARAKMVDGVEVFMGPSRHVGQKAVPEEFGSINNAPHGYMRGAWDGHAAGLLNGLADDLGDAVMGAANRHAKRQARKG